MLNEARMDVLERNAEAGNSETIQRCMLKLSIEEQLEYARELRREMNERAAQDTTLPHLSIAVGVTNGHRVLTGITSFREVGGMERLQSPQYWINPIERKVLYHRPLK